MALGTTSRQREERVKEEEGGEIERKRQKVRNEAKVGNEAIRNGNR
jgi:hypothetical protein